jgi:hypothetical protein
MQVKGAAIESITKFVRTNFNNKYESWINSLSGESQQIMKEQILSNSWYPLESAMIEPLKKICDLFYDGNVKGAWESGRFAADIALKGILKFFVRIGNPRYMITRSNGIISSYYKSGDIKIIELKQNTVAIYISNFDEMNQLIENRIAGWLQRALEINGCSNILVNIQQSITQENDICEMIVSWE